MDNDTQRREEEVAAVDIVHDVREEVPEVRTGS